jgi:hypothetical protein
VAVPRLIPVEKSAHFSNVEARVPASIIAGFERAQAPAIGPSGCAGNVRKRVSD